MEFSIFVFLLVMVGGFVILPLFLKVFFGDNKIAKVINGVLLVLYILSAFALTLSDVQLGWTCHIEFVTVGDWFDSEIYIFNLLQLKDIIQNLLFMTPLGIFTYKTDRFWVTNLWIAFLAGAGLGFVIESLQFILPIDRFPQVSDVLLNGVSAVIGFVAILIVDIVSNVIHRKRGYDLDE